MGKKMKYLGWEKSMRLVRKAENVKGNKGKRRMKWKKKKFVKEEEKKVGFYLQFKKRLL